MVRVTFIEVSVPALPRRATFEVDARGDVVAVKLNESTHPDFGAALTTAIRAHDFDPAVRENRGVGGVGQVECAFQLGVPNPSVSESDLKLLSVEKENAAKIVRADKLDAPLKAISQPAPVFPLGAKKGKPGEALIEFLVDERGVVRLPRVVSATDPIFGFAGVQTVARWSFEPPESAGEPVVVRVSAPVVFSTK